MSEALEWQVAEGSATAHVLDAEQDGWKHPDGRRKMSGPRSICGRYPQRNAEQPWFALSVNEPGVLDALRHYHVRLCGDCEEALHERAA